MYINARVCCPKKERDFRLDVAETVMAPEGMRLESIIRRMEAAFETQRRPEDTVKLHVCLSAYTSIDRWNPDSDAPLEMIMHSVAVERKDAFSKVFQAFEGFRSAIGE